MDWKKTATRLKELRIEKGLSHAKLKEELEKKYEEFTISELSLKKYEVTDETHRDAKSVCGMKTEYLYYFADFYGVTTDYIIGRSDFKEIPMDEAIKKTGLSVSAIEFLARTKEEDNPIYLNLISEILASNDFSFVIDYLGKAGILLKHYKKTDISELKYSVTDFKEQYTLNEFVDDIKKHDALKNSRLFTVIEKSSAAEYYIYEAQKIFGQIAENIVFDICKEG